MKETPAPQAPDNKKEKDKKRKKSIWVWPIQATVISLVLAAVFSLMAEVSLTDAHIAVAVVLLVVLVGISIFFDMLGIAVTGCDASALNSMAARKVRGARHALHLAQNAGKVSSIFNDIVGDSIGIITGVCGAALAYQLASGLSTRWATIAVSVAVSAVIAAFTIGGKAFMKQVALRHSTAIVLAVGRFFALFRKESRRRK